MKTDKALAALPTISASRIKVFKTCARQYYYKYMLPFHQRPADDKNVAALLGTALHKAIEEKYRNNANATAVFQEVMEATIQQWEKDRLKINMAGYYTTALNVGKNILRSFNWDQFTPLELEHEFTLPFPNAEKPLVNITGYIDMITTDGKVIDHKSASQAPNQDELNHDPQFVLYAWAYQQLYGKKPTAVIWNHLRTGKLYQADTGHYHDKLDQLTQDITAMLNAGHFVRRKMDKVCKTECSFFILCYGEKVKVVEGE